MTATVLGLGGEAAAKLAVGLVLLVAAGFALRGRRALAEQAAALNRLQYDRRVSLLNRERAERLARAHATGPLDVWGVVLGCVLAALIGVLLIVSAFVAS